MRKLPTRIHGMSNGEAEAGWKDYREGVAESTTVVKTREDISDARSGFLSRSAIPATFLRKQPVRG
jgi:hypothetical protein